MESIELKISLKNTHGSISDNEAIKQMKKAVSSLISQGALKGTLSKIILDFNIVSNSGSDYAIVSIDKSSFKDGSKLTSVGASLIPSGDPILSTLGGESKTFSITTIKERIRVGKMSPRVRFRLTIVDYKKYYMANKTALDKDPAHLAILVRLFLSDLMEMFDSVLPYIKDGKQLGQMLGIEQVARGLNQSARELSIAYKKALNSEETSGAPTPSFYKLLAAKYKEFINQLLIQIFPGIDAEKVKADGKPKFNIGAGDGDEGDGDEGDDETPSTQKSYSFSII